MRIGFQVPTEVPTEAVYSALQAAYPHMLFDRSSTERSPARRVEFAVPPSPSGSTDSEHDLQLASASRIRRTFSQLSQVGSCGEHSCTALTPSTLHCQPRVPVEELCSDQ
jgi:hypothetical protein